MNNPRSVIADIAEPFMGLEEETYNRAKWLKQLWAATNYPDGMQDKAPYCAAGVCFCIQEAIKKEPLLSVRNRPKTAAVREFVTWSLLAANGCETFRWTSPSSVPMPDRGDLVVFTWSHIGIVSGTPVYNKTTGSHMIPTYEFNTSSGEKGSQRDGGGNFKRERYKSDCSLFIRVPLKAEKA